MDYLEISGIGQIKVKRGANIKFLSIRMAPGKGIWINVPYGVSKKMVDSFLAEKRDWIISTKKHVDAYEEETGVGLKIGAEITTKMHVLKIAETEKTEASYKVEQKNITLFIPKKTDFKKIEHIVQGFLLDIYLMECKHILPKRVRYLAEKFGFRYKRLSFRNNVSNWGSCSHDDNISLNIKLMKLPDEIIDYVILHELCHTIEKNHSADFWKLMHRVCPSYGILRERLRKYNTRL